MLQDSKSPTANPSYTKNHLNKLETMASQDTYIILLMIYGMFMLQDTVVMTEMFGILLLIF